MTLLWSQAVLHQAMPWYQERGEQHPVVHSVRHVGFAGYTDNKDQLAQEAEDSDYGDNQQDDFDEDLHNETSPTPTPEEEAHHEEHGEFPQDYNDRHDAAYAKGKERKAQENEPDDHNPDLMRFVQRHNSDTALWKSHGTFGPVDLKQPIHATQSHVSQLHLDKYHADAQSKTHRQEKFRDLANDDYLGDQSPLFVTHRGKVHAIEGHHRVGAALQRGDHSINAWHYDLDHNPGNVSISPHDDDDDDDGDDW